MISKPSIRYSLFSKKVRINYKLICYKTLALKATTEMSKALILQIPLTIQVHIYSKRIKLQVQRTAKVVLGDVLWNRIAWNLSLEILLSQALFSLPEVLIYILSDRYLRVSFKTCLFSLLQYNIVLTVMKTAHCIAIKNITY